MSALSSRRGDGGSVGGGSGLPAGGSRRNETERGSTGVAGPCHCCVSVCSCVVEAKVFSSLQEWNESTLHALDGRGESEASEWSAAASAFARAVPSPEPRLERAAMNAAAATADDSIDDVEAKETPLILLS